MSGRTFVEHLHVGGFRSLADIEIRDLSGVSVLIGANGAGKPNRTYGAHLTSDGSLRLFALVTLLNLTAGMLPDVMLLDEPELGLHPAAIGLIAGMIKQRSVDRQLIVATQSPRFVDSFDLEEIIVLDLRDGQTVCRKLDPDEYRVWLDEFAPGELWEKNLLGNDGERTHPSRRIEDLMPSYHKRVHGSDLARSMGLATIRAECPGFDEWVGRLESWGHA